jgi:FxsC-like protein
VTYWFFLSYARRDAVRNTYFAEFFEDLALQVARLAPLPSHIPTERIGFLDARGVEPGETWPAALSEALETSRVLICAFSPAYFASEYCGKEFAAFRYRPEPAILPVLWERPGRISVPRPVAEYQRTWAGLGSDYLTEGALALKKRRNRFGEAYDDLLDALAELVVRRARDAQLPNPGTIPPLEKVSSAFGSPWSDRDGAAASGPVGPGSVKFVFVAATRPEMSPVLGRADYYGETERDWRPFGPDVITTVGFHAQRAATEAHLYSDHVPVGPSTLDSLRAAEASNTIAVLVVDPWSLKLPSYRRLLEDYDRQRFKNCAVLVVANEADPRTTAARDGLRRDIEQTLERNLLEGSVFDQVGSAAALELQLVAAIGKVRKQLMGRAAVHIPTGPAASVPQIVGPGGTAA